MEGLAGRSVAVTGAGGFIGRALCARLASAGALVTGLDVDDSARGRVTGSGATFRLCDTSSTSAVQDALAGAELVVHSAAVVSDWGAMADFVRVNVGGTRNVLDAAERLRCDRIVHISSVASWGYEHRDALDEDSPPRPCGVPYIDTKGASDALALDRARRGEPVAVIRPGDVYGPGSTPWAVRPLEALRANRFMLIGRGQGVMTPVYIDDLVESIVLALTASGATGRGYTVWDGVPVSVAEFFGHYARMLGRAGIPRLPRPLAELVAGAQEAVAAATGRPPMFSRNAITFVSRRAAYSNRRAREVLGWAPRVMLEEGMRRTEWWFRQEGLLPELSKPSQEPAPASAP
jgi:nucleoside-diphosphate-sugar epimerase